jgi:hypothetical protein
VSEVIAAPARPPLRLWVRGVGVLAALAVLAMLVLTGQCGDQSVALTFVNTGDDAITIYPEGVRYPTDQFMLAPREERSTNLLVGVHTVEGVASDGTVVFCHVYDFPSRSYFDGPSAKSAAFVIQVHSGVLDCR